MTAGRGGERLLMDDHVKTILGYCMDAVRNCDEIPDEDGYCRCARYIGFWLNTFWTNQQAAYHMLDASIEVNDE